MPDWLDARIGLGDTFSLLRALEEASAREGWAQVLCVDIDRLSGVNRRAGFAAGSQSLGDLARLLAALAPGGSAYRLGADEFYWLRVAGEPGEGELVRLAERLRRDFAATMRRRGLDLTVSVGILEAELPTPCGRLLALPHYAVARAKAQGGNRVVDGEPVDDLPESTYALVTSLVVKMNDSARSTEAARLEAFTDAITRLPNHRAGRAMLERVVEAAAREGQRAGIIFVDGDGLRLYNEMGYEAGNRMIRELSEIMRRSLREDDFIARWLSGDEFLIIVRGADAQAACLAAERIRGAVETETLSWPIPVTVSLAVCSCPEHGTDVDTILAKLYQAGHEAKESGKNRVVLVSA